VNRWRSLEAEIREEESLNFVSSRLSSTIAPCAPILEDVRLHLSRSTRPDTTDTWPLFAGNIPQLRDLQLMGYYLPPDPAGFSGLRKLDLRQVKFQNPESLREQILHILEACPQLETLNLERIEMGRSVAAEYQHHMLTSTFIDLPYLRTLSLAYIDHRLTRAIISSIRTSSLQLSLLLDLTTNEDMRDIFPRSDLDGKYHVPNLEIAHVLEFRCNSQQWQMTAWDNENEVKLVDIRCRCRFGAQAEPSERCFESFSRDLSCPTVEKVSFYGLGAEKKAGGVPMKAPQFVQILACLPLVTDITLVDCSSSLSNVLIFTSRRRLFPLLRRLRLEKCGITSGNLLSLVKSRSKSADGSSKQPDRLRVLQIVCCEHIYELDPQLRCMLDEVEFESAPNWFLDFL